MLLIMKVKKDIYQKYLIILKNIKNKRNNMSLYLLMKKKKIKNKLTNILKKLGKAKYSFKSRNLMMNYINFIMNLVNALSVNYW